ncbi:MAG: hypothetical protein WBX01_17340 [Nitrososphaeraceae archaeon]
MLETSELTVEPQGLVPRSNIDWQNTVIPRIAELTDEYIEREGDKPTLRTMYYVGLDEGLYPAVYSSYKGLSNAIVQHTASFLLETCMFQYGRHTIDIENK